MPVVKGWTPRLKPASRPGPTLCCINHERTGAMSGEMFRGSVKRVATQGVQRLVATDVDPIPLNCPRCGCQMEPPFDSAERSAGLILVECPLHGLFHFGPTVNLTAGPPDSPLPGS